jgi:small subunit ribosomal protein S6
MPFYETTIIVRQDLSRADVTKFADQYTAIIEQNGGKVVKNEYWGLKSLAYKVEKNRKGHYTMLAIDAPADAVKEMERQIRINEDIIRVLTVRVEAISEGPSVMMNNNRRDDIPGEGEEPFVAANA